MLTTEYDVNAPISQLYRWRCREDAKVLTKRAKAHTVSYRSNTNVLSYMVSAMESIPKPERESYVSVFEYLHNSCPMKAHYEGRADGR